MNQELHPGDQVVYMHNKSKYPKRGKLIVQQVKRESVICLHLDDDIFLTLDLNPQFLQLKTKKTAVEDTL